MPADAGQAFAGSSVGLASIDTVDAGLSSLRRVLQVNKGWPAYDQLLASELSQRLQTAVARLVDNVDVAQPPVGTLTEMRHQAHSMQRHAKNLVFAISRRADRDVVADELKQFDGVWGAFLRLAGDSPRLDDQLRAIMNDIGETDHRLNRELGVPQAIPAAPATLDRELANVAATANGLVLTLESELPRGPSSILNAAQGFAAEAEACSLGFVNQAAIVPNKQNFRPMMGSWRELRYQLDNLERSAAPASWEHIDRLEKEVRQIQLRLLHNQYGPSPGQSAAYPAPPRIEAR